MRSEYVDARVDSELEGTIIMESFSHIALGLISEVYIHCKDSYEAMSLEEAAANPIGSGPYKFVEWVKDDRTVLEKWDEFTLRDSTYDILEWRVMPEASTRTAELIAGNVDIITNVPTGPARSDQRLWCGRGRRRRRHPPHVCRLQPA